MTNILDGKIEAGTSMRSVEISPRVRLLRYCIGEERARLRMDNYEGLNGLELDAESTGYVVGLHHGKGVLALK